MAVERMGFVLDQDGDLAQTGVQAVAEREVDDAVFPAERNSRFRALIRQRDAVVRLYRPRAPW